MDSGFEWILKLRDSLVLSREVANCITKRFEKEDEIKVLESTSTEESTKLLIRFEPRRRLLINRRKEYRTKTAEAQRMKEEHFLFEDMLKAVNAEINALNRNFHLSITKDRIVIKVNESEEEFSEMSKLYLRKYCNRIISLVVRALKEVGIKSPLKQ